MKRGLFFEIRIWKWQELLHKGNYEFGTPEEAQYYALGMFDYARLKDGATGYGLEPIEKPTTPEAQREFIDKNLNVIFRKKENHAVRMRISSVTSEGIVKYSEIHHPCAKEQPLNDFLEKFEPEPKV